MIFSHESIVTRLKEYLDKTSTSQNLAAQQMGVSPATLSNILTGKHDKISNEMWQKVAAYLLPDSWKIVATTNYATIVSECEYAQTHACMRPIIGATGLGKTTALRRYKMTKPNVFYVLCQESMNVKELVKAIARELGLELEATKHMLIRQVSDALVERARPLLILDDAGKLNDKKLHVIQQIYDLTEGKAGIVVAGVDYLYDNLVRGAERGRMGYPELKSRMGHLRRVVAPKPIEYERVAKENGIEASDVLQWVKANSKSLRDLRSVVLSYHRYQKEHGRPMRVEELEELFTYKPN